MCDGFLRKLDMIHGYVVSDITQFPKVPYWLVELRLSANGGTMENWPRPPRFLDGEPLSSCRRCHELEPTRSV
jgi:hypothetical protein